MYPNFDAATSLRRRFDPQYLLGKLDQSWLDDLKRYNRALDDDDKRHDRRLAIIESAQERQKLLDTYLEEHPKTISVDDPRTVRVLRVGVHIDYEDAATLLDRWSNDEDVGDDLGEALKKIADKRDYFTRLLLAVRTHHTLTRLELEDYEYYLNRILSAEADLPDMDEPIEDVLHQSQSERDKTSPAVSV